MRFLFITCIVCGHFIRFASPSDFWFKFFSQHNVIVGAFFALSGYVTAYTSTEVGLPKASPKLTDTPSQEWILSRVFGYFPLHLATLLLFSPLFVYVDMYYSGIVTTLRNAILSVTMTQSWFPNLAEIWNAPTVSTRRE
jgi:peptidoglycan/LPS O-acetylase OafA/YrhL